MGVNQQFINTIAQGDCLEVMKLLAPRSVDMILCDLPYGTTQCPWDTIIPFPELWEQYLRVIKPNGAIVLTGSQPFTSMIVNSKPDLFRYEIIWKKTVAANFYAMKREPRKLHENVLVFYQKQPTYNPQMEEGRPYVDKARPRRTGIHGDAVTTKKPIENTGTRYPSSVQAFEPPEIPEEVYDHSVREFANPNNKTFHPTQKPVSLFAWLIETYTSPGEVVLDNCMGSGTTAEAALRTGRQFIGIELTAEYTLKGNMRAWEVEAELNRAAEVC